MNSVEMSCIANLRILQRSKTVTVLMGINRCIIPTVANHYVLVHVVRLMWMFWQMAEP